MAVPTLERLAYNIDETAKLTGLSANVVARELREGRLKHVRCGRRVLISEQAIRDFLAGEQAHAAMPSHQ